MLIRFIAILLFCMFNLSSADELICDPIPESIAEKKAVFDYNISASIVDIQVPKFYDSQRFSGLILRINPDLRVRNRTRLESRLKVDETNGLINSTFNISEYEYDTVALRAIYLNNLCVSHLDSILKLEELTNRNSSGSSSGNMHSIDIPFASSPSPSPISNTYSFTYDKVHGGKSSGKLGEFAINFHDESGYGGYSFATITIHKKAGVNIPVEILDISVHEHQCESIPSSVVRYSSAAPEGIAFPRTISVTETSCIELQYHVRKPFSIYHVEIDKFQIRLIK